MSAQRVLVLAMLGGLVFAGLALAQAGRGGIEGRVVREDGSGVGGVTVVVNETGMAEVTDALGAFHFSGVPVGAYTLSFTLGDNADSEPGVEVTAGQTTTVEKTVAWELSFAETITVISASRRPERIVEAPAAVTLVTEEEIERQGSHGQLPKLLEFTPGVEATQSGLYDYNFNTRGFNSSLNRRVQVLVDGRDSAVPFLASQEWGIVSQYMNDLASAELVRGPSSALYGKNAFNGVLNLITRAPRDSPGGMLRLSAGNLSTLKGDFRWAGELGGGWHARLNASYLDGEDFSVDRHVTQEYAGLVPEVRPLVTDTNEYTFGNLRFDKYFGSDFLTFEGGYVDAAAPAIQTGIGRFSLPSVERTWTRFNYTSEHFNFLGYLNDRSGEKQTSVQSGVETYLDSQNYHLEFQTNWSFADGRARLVAGASHREEEIDSANPAGRQTLLFQGVDSDSQALYGQVDFDLGERVKLVLAGRYDESTLHDSRFSPKGALVVSLNAKNTLRFGYNEAFQVGNYSELFLQADGAPPITALAPFEGLFCAPFGVSCGFDQPVRILALGNRNLQVEEITSFEVGYSGILGRKAFLTIDYYTSELENFITDLLPNVGTALGRLNPDFGSYQPPSGLPGPIETVLLDTLLAALGPNFFAMSNNLDGSPILAAVSYTNFGQVDTQGADLGLTVYATPEWRVNFSYSWFDFDIKQELPGDPLVPNAPETKGSVGLAYVADAFDASISARFVDGFPWSVGTLFRGDVPSYETVDLNFNYRVNENVSVGVNVSNLLDDEHYQAFGGDLLGRRALGNIAFRF